MATKKSKNAKAKNKKNAKKVTSSNNDAANAALASRHSSQPGKSRKQKKGGTKAAASPSSGFALPGFLQGRRNLLKAGGVAGLAIFGGGWIHAKDSQNREMHDLSAIGNGTPVVLQVHDPSCALCRQLKRSTETALEELPQLTYRIADLTSKEGREFAEKYNAGKVTLLLFDGKGKHLGTVNGTTPAPELVTTFKRHFRIRPA